jgi:hypothetical protein
MPASGRWDYFAAVLTPSTPFAYPQVASRTFASFRVVHSGISAGQRDFCNGFDSRQLHNRRAQVRERFPSLGPFTSTHSPTFWVYDACLASRRSPVGTSLLPSRRPPSPWHPCASAPAFGQFEIRPREQDVNRRPRRPAVLRRAAPRLASAHVSLRERPSTH